MVIKIKKVRIASDNQRFIPIVMGKKSFLTYCPTCDREFLVHTPKQSPRIVPAGIYKTCKEQLSWLVKEQVNDNTIEGHTEVYISIGTYKDIGNSIKIICDALENAQAITSDGLIQDLYIHKEFYKKGQPEDLTIEVKKAKTDLEADNEKERD